MLSHYFSRISIALLMFAITQPAWSSDYNPTPVAQITAQVPTIEIRNAKQPFPGLLTGGQPSQAQLIEAKEKGYKTIISLRTRAETGEWDEEKTVQGLGMKYISIPIGSANDLSSKNAKALISALSNPKDYPMMLHCASGNRIGALFAVDAGLNQHIAAEKALQIGRDSGMTRLEPVVKKILN